MDGSWFALPRIAYGTAVGSWEPLGDVQPHQIPLQIGDEIYAIEEFRPNRSSDEDAWFRGFVVATSPFPRDPSSSLAARSTTSTPQVAIGVFPKKFVHVREYLEDAEGRLVEQQGPSAQQANGRMPVLEEEPEEEEVQDLQERLKNGLGRRDSRIDPAASKTRNRTSVGSLASFLGQLTAEQQKSLQKARALISNKKQHQEQRQTLPLPNLKCGDETTSGLGEPLVDEIACALREWSMLQYGHLTRKSYDLFDSVLANFNEVHAGRKLLLAKNLSIDETATLRSSLVTCLLRGNLLQGLDVITRHPRTGALLDLDADSHIGSADWLSAVRAYALQVMSASIDPSSQNKLALVAHPSSNPMLCSVPGEVASANQRATNTHIDMLVKVRSLRAQALSPGERVEVCLSLFSKDERRFVTEEFCVVLDHTGRLPNHVREPQAALQALFGDLTASDFDGLYLVCRLVRNGYFRPLGQSSSSNGASIEDGTLPKFSAASKESNLLVDSHGRTSYRRPFACAVAELGQYMSPSTLGSTQVLQMPAFAPSEEIKFGSLHESLIASVTKDFEKTPMIDSVVMDLRLFSQNEAPADESLGAVSRVQRLGFPDVVFPEVRRNDVYFKLWSGDFSSPAALTPSKPTNKSKGLGSLASAAASATVGTSKNIEVTVELRLRDGTRMDNSISRGGNEPKVSQYCSTTLKSTSYPLWAEVLKIDLRPDLLPQCHLFLSFRARPGRDKPASESDSEKPFAFAYLPLVEESSAFLQDGSHSLVLYRYDRNVALPAMYLQVPATSKPGENVFISPSLAKALVPLKDSVVVRSLLVSTEYTTNETLLKLLSWNKSPSSTTIDMKRTLTELQFCSENEICKFLRDVFDALFNVLGSKENETGDLDALVFETLVRILGIVSDRRFANFKSVLDIYIREHFQNSVAYRYILKCFGDLCRRHGESGGGPQLRSAIKVLNYLVRFIIRSREVQRAKEVGSGVTADHLESNFRRDLSQLLAQINTVMKAKSPSSVIGTQTLLVQHFGPVIPELVSTFDKDELTDVVIAFCDSISFSKGKIQVWRVLLYRSIVESELFKTPSSRAMLVPSLSRWLKAHLGAYDEDVMTNPADSQAIKDSTRITWLECSRLATSVVASMLDVVHSALADPEVIASRELTGLEQDNIEYLLALVARLLNTATDSADPAHVEALLRQPSHVSAVSALPVIFPSTYPFPTLAASTKSGEQIDDLGLESGRCEAVFLAFDLLAIAPPKILQNWLESMLEVEGPDKFVANVAQIFRSGTSVIGDHVYPAKWLNVVLFSHRVLLKMCSCSAPLLEREFLPPRSDAGQFRQQLWVDFMQLLVRLLGSSHLLIEEFSPQKRRSVWRLGGDMRAEGSVLLADLWQKLGWPAVDEDLSAALPRQGGYQIQFVPALVEDVLSLCISHHDQLRAVAVNILFSMIVNEYKLNGNFALIQAEIIDRLDRLFMNQTKGDEISRAFFVGQLRSLFAQTNAAEDLRAQVDTFLDSVDSFLDLVLAVRSLPDGEEYQEDRITGTLRLMDFVRNIGRNSIYIVYVNRLVGYHVALGNHTEAGLTLKLHADLHKWDLHKILDPIPELDLPKQSEFARKEKIYMRVIDYLNKGKAWETAIEVCKQLAVELETQTYNYLRLSEVLLLQAELYANITRSVRQFGAYFRVAFYGTRWPVSLAGKHFVYRGNEGEGSAAFTQRLLSKYAGATLLKTSSIPDDETQNGDVKLIQITSVTPEPDLETPFFLNPEVPHAVRQYYEHNEVARFSFSRSIERTRKRNESMALTWTEKTVLICESKFPTILPRSEVVELQVVEISPIENAVADVTKKVNELKQIEQRFVTVAKTASDDASVNTNVLSMALNSAIDAPVNQGIPMYRREFLTPDYVRSRPEAAKIVSELRDAIDELARHISRCLKLHAALCPPEMMPFHETLESFFARNFADEISRLPRDASHASDLPLSPLLATRDFAKLRSNGFGSISISAAPALGSTTQTPVKNVHGLLNGSASSTGSNNGRSTPSTVPRDSIFSVLGSPLANRRESGAMSPTPGTIGRRSETPTIGGGGTLRAGSISGFSFTSGDGRSMMSGSSIRDSARRASGQLMNTLKWTKKRPSIGALAEMNEEKGSPIF